MKFITVSELRANATRIVAEIETTREEVIVTKNGRPVVLIRPVEEKEFKLKTSMKGGKKHGKGKRAL
ncbi:MAG: type II toxin-antitoxin system Phd/YefM family antitoxin [Deltaproteobacteria bacterium]|nr:type II toxin-antitoxin system Phd/YefM family antitoxin [Deltaproteobacteria bacterium]